MNGQPLLPGAGNEAIHTYMRILAAGETVANVSDLCRRAPISRTTFYRQFESLDDLDARFLRLYFQATYRPQEPGIGVYQRATGFLTNVVASMRAQQDFFRRILVQKTPPGYDTRWWDAVDDYFRSRLADVQMAPTRPLWRYHQELTLGVIHQLFAIGVQVPPGDVPELVRATLDFLWSGTQGFIDHAQGHPSSAERHLAPLVERMRGKL